MPPGDDAGALLPAPKVFVEFAAFDGDTTSRGAHTAAPFDIRQFEHGMNDPKSGARHAGGLLATSGVVSRMPWDVGKAGPGVADGGAASQWELAITPHVGSPAEALRIEIAIEPAAAAPPQATALRADRGARTTLVVRDQQPIVLGLVPSVTGVGGERGATLLVTPYIVRREDDVRRLFECKMANRARFAR
jgi:hypothetical protein